VTAITESSAPLPRWLVDAVMGLVASAYEAGRADAAPAPVVEQRNLLTRREAAKELHCSLTTLDRLIGENALRSAMVRGRRYVPRDAIAEYLGTASA